MAYGLKACSCHPLIMPQTISQEGLKEHLNQVKVFRLANMVWGGFEDKAQTRAEVNHSEMNE